MSLSVLLPPGLRGAELLITQGSGATTAQSRVLSEFLGEWEHLLESGERGRDKDHVMVKGWLDLPLILDDSIRTAQRPWLCFHSLAGQKY